MGKWIKWGMLWVAVTALIGLWTLWRWQTSAPDIDLQDILIHFLLMPLAIVLAWWMALRGLKRWQTRRQAAHLAKTGATSASLAGAGSNAAEADARGEQALRLAHVLVVEAAAHTRAGADAASAWSGVSEGKLSYELDRTLLDLDGLPVFSARVPDLDADVSDALTQQIDERPASEPGAEPGPEPEPVRLSVRRAVVLSQMPCEQLHAALEAMLDAVDKCTGAPDRPMLPATGAAPGAFDLQAKSYLSGLPGPSGSGQGAAGAGGAPVEWQCRVLMPPHWALHEQDALVSAWRQRSAELCERAQGLGWPQPVWQAVPPESPEAWWAELDTDMVRAQREGRACVWMVLAVDSALDDATVEHWQSIGELFTAHHQTGRVPGEAAAGLLLISPAMRDRLGEVAWPAPLVRMSRPAIGKRDKSADAAGRVGGRTLTELMQGVLSTLDSNRVEANGAGVADAPASPRPAFKVITDADHRGSRIGEVFDALQAVVPGTDPMASVVRMGEALGDVGMARSLLATALGCAAVRQAEGQEDGPGPILAAHVQSPRDRVVVALCAVPDGV